MASEIQTTTAEIPDTAQYGWHFSEGPTGTLHDGSPVPDVGMVHSVEGDIEIRRNAMHGCPSAFDALQYAPGPYVERVAIWGDVEEDGDKIGGRHRVVLWREDARTVLRAFARWVALYAVEEHCPRERAEDEGVAEEWDTMVAWLESGEGDRAAAKYAAKAARRLAKAATKAAWDAAWDAAKAAEAAAGAARYAARYAAKYAAKAATRAAWAAAADADGDAAWDVARDAAWERYDRWLTDAVMEMRGEDGDDDG